MRKRADFSRKSAVNDAGHAGHLNLFALPLLNEGAEKHP